MDIYLVNSGKCDFLDPNPPLRNALFKNNRDGSFTDVTEKAGVGSGFYGMGVAVGDYDNDGYPDMFVTQYGRSILYHNNGRWRVYGRHGKGGSQARITYQAGDLRRHRMKVGGGSFLSSHDPRMLRGLGGHTKLDWVEVKWPQPSTLVERFTDLCIDKYVKLVEGSGKRQE